MNTATTYPVLIYLGQRMGDYEFETVLTYKVPVRTKNLEQYIFKNLVRNWYSDGVKDNDRVMLFGGGELAVWVNRIEKLSPEEAEVLRKYL